MNDLGGSQCIVTCRCMQVVLGMRRDGWKGRRPACLPGLPRNPTSHRNRNLATTPGLDPRPDAPSFYLWNARHVPVPLHTRHVPVPLHVHTTGELTFEQSRRDPPASIHQGRTRKS